MPKRDERGRFVSEYKTAEEYREAVEAGELSKSYGLRRAAELERIESQFGDRYDPDDRFEQAESQFGEQERHFIDLAIENTPYASSRADLLDNDDFREAYDKAFGYDPVEGPPEDFDYQDAGYHETHGYIYESQRDYAEFLADWCGFDHDEIDYALGYEEKTG